MRYKIAIIDDNEDLLSVTHSILSKYLPDADIDSYCDPKELSGKLDDYDFVVSDWNFGMRVLGDYAEWFKHPRLIIVSGTESVFKIKAMSFFRKDRHYIKDVAELIKLYIEFNKN